jgi:hypothetical protein
MFLEMIYYAKATENETKSKKDQNQKKDTGCEWSIRSVIIHADLKYAFNEKEAVCFLSRRSI